MAAAARRFQGIAAVVHLLVASLVTGQTARRVRDRPVARHITGSERERAAAPKPTAPFFVSGSEVIPFLLFRCADSRPDASGLTPSASLPSPPLPSHVIYSLEAGRVPRTRVRVIRRWPAGVLIVAPDGSCNQLS